ncbi:hypothetical protein F4782DRAFT_29066 [Xylaria castorea]|nr:hypothetical protein F4782DRAFT_29066 [Xylaria castorea]
MRPEQFRKHLCDRAESITGRNTGSKKRRRNPSDQDEETSDEDIIYKDDAYKERRRRRSAVWHEEHDCEDMNRGRPRHRDMSSELNFRRRRNRRKLAGLSRSFTSFSLNESNAWIDQSKEELRVRQNRFLCFMTFLQMSSSVSSLSMLAVPSVSLLISLPAFVPVRFRGDPSFFVVLLEDSASSAGMTFHERKPRLLQRLISLAFELHLSESNDRGQISFLRARQRDIVVGDLVPPTEIHCNSF